MESGEKKLEPRSVFIMMGKKDHKYSNNYTILSFLLLFFQSQLSCYTRKMGT